MPQRQIPVPPRPRRQPIDRALQRAERLPRHDGAVQALHARALGHDAAPHAGREAGRGRVVLEAGGLRRQVHLVELVLPLLVVEVDEAVPLAPLRLGDLERALLLRRRDRAEDGEDEEGEEEEATHKHTHGARSVCLVGWW